VYEVATGTGGGEVTVVPGSAGAEETEVVSEPGRRGALTIIVRLAVGCAGVAVPTALQVAV
jgi:hypothetical protein